MVEKTVGDASFIAIACVETTVLAVSLNLALIFHHFTSKL